MCGFPPLLQLWFSSLASTPVILQQLRDSYSMLLWFCKRERVWGSFTKKTRYINPLLLLLLSIALAVSILQLQVFFVLIVISSLDIGVFTVVTFVMVMLQVSFV